MKNRYIILYVIIVHLSCSRSIYRVCRILVHIFLTNDILKEYYIDTTAEEATFIVGVRYAFDRRLSNDYIVRPRWGAVYYSIYLSYYIITVHRAGVLNDMSYSLCKFRFPIRTLQSVKSIAPLVKRT